MTTLCEKLEAFSVSLRLASSQIESAKSRSEGGLPLLEVLFNVGGALFELETHVILPDRVALRSTFSG